MADGKMEVRTMLRQAFLNRFKPDPALQKMSFRERWKHDMEKNKASGTDAYLLMIIIRTLMCFYAVAKTYAFLWHITHFLLRGYGPWAIYYFNVTVCFTMINTMANWLLIMLVDSTYGKTRDNPYLDNDVKESNETFVPRIEISNRRKGKEKLNNANGHSVYNIGNDEGLQWRYCDKCVIYIPPRAYHCVTCKKCMLKRDHHCYLVGNCIAFKNQRYFIVWTFYIALHGILGGLCTYSYVSQIVCPKLEYWYDALFPIAIWKSLFGYVPAFHAVLLFILALEIVCGPLGLFFFISQIVIGSAGKTMFEVVKKAPITNTNSGNRNLRSVFGSFWPLNFLFPMTFIFRQTDDGIHWENVKIDYANRNATK